MIATGPARQRNGRMKYVLHALYHKRARFASDVEQPLDPQHVGTAQCGQRFNALLEGAPGKRLLETQRKCVDRGIVRMIEGVVSGSRHAHPEFDPRSIRLRVR